jgi:hypothetical protein
MYRFIYRRAAARANACTLEGVTRRGTNQMQQVLCECQGQASLMDDDDAFDSDRCVDCGAQTKPGRFRCDPCQLDVQTRRRKAREALVAGYRETQRTIPL